MALYPGLVVDAVGPDVDIAARREIAPLPARVPRLPWLRQRPITEGERFGASLPKRAASAPRKSPVETPRR